MSTIYMSQLSTAFPLMEEDHHQDHHQGHFQAFTLPKDPPILFPFVINNSSPSDNSLSYGSDHHLRQHQAMLEPQHMIGGPSSVFTTPFPTVESIHDDMIERSSYDPYNIEKLHAISASAKSGKWTAPAPAKMRITRKASDPGVGGAAVKKPPRKAQAYEDDNYSSGAMNQPLGVIRVCSDCNTTKTPLWRSGPCGPKSLCNACGIRQRKARRAMMASGTASPADGSAKAAGSGVAATTVPAHPKVKKEKRADVDRSLPFKKRCKVMVQDQEHTATNVVGTATGAAAVVEAADPVVVVTAAGPARDLADSIGVKWSKSPTTAAMADAACSFRSSSAPAFAVQDEITDAAMLLMTLSCQLIRS